HNLKKCKDEEYLKCVLIAVGGMNELAESVFGNGVMRMFERRPHLIDTFMPDLQLVQVDGIETAGCTLDWPRFENSIAAVVQGLFFYETGNKLKCNVRVAWAHRLSANYSSAPHLEVVRSAAQIPANYLGANPKVFQFALDKCKSGETWLWLRFYEGLPICVTWNEKIPIL
ncbi:MAG: hypothetical protein ACR2H1_06525, partial [Limisphaerales bacterium]